MAIATLTIDPGVAALTPNDHITAINAATAPITRAASVSAAARPIATGEVDSAKIADGSVAAGDLAPAAARDNLLAMADIDRKVVVTRPVAASGDYKAIALKRTAAGLVEVEYDDVAV